ncbi:MAG: hypothetical protein JW976_14965 [Syntrophaceae bacterium]|nr:hypothetical protein [Syntrophaceae bacterium]
MYLECPHCKTEYNSEDIAHTLKNGYYKCPVCEKKFSSPLANNPQSNVSSTPKGKYIIPAFIILGIAAVSAFFLFFQSSDKITEKIISVAPAITEPPSNPSPPQVSAPSLTPATQETIPTTQELLVEPPQAPPVPKKPDKMQIIERIAAIYNFSHSYTMEEGFVCLDMAIDVWNQLKTYGIEAKIMGGTIRENITAWNFRQLAMESNHAWVVAIISSTEKVAIETTAGKVIKQGTTDAAPYFKGIAFDDPAQIKRFELLRKSVLGNCRDASILIDEFNKDAAEKQLRPEEIIARKSQIEQRKQDCEKSFNYLKEFESKAVFY